MSLYFNTIRTTEGKYVTQVRTVNADGTEVTHYESPEYLTYYMASADANCWKEFHMVEKKDERREYSIDEGDKVYEFGSKLNTTAVVALISETIAAHPKTEIKIGPLTGLMAQFEGFKFQINMPGKITRTFDIIKPEGEK